MGRDYGYLLQRLVSTSMNISYKLSWYRKPRFLRLSLERLYGSEAHAWVKKI